MKIRMFAAGVLTMLSVLGMDNVASAQPGYGCGPRYGVGPGYRHGYGPRRAYVACGPTYGYAPRRFRPRPYGGYYRPVPAPYYAPAPGVNVSIGARW